MILYFDVGKICVPLLASEVEMFDPGKCPTIAEVLMEFDTVQGILTVSIALSGSF